MQVPRRGPNVVTGLMHPSPNLIFLTSLSCANADVPSAMRAAAIARRSIEYLWRRASKISYGELRTLFVWCDLSGVGWFFIVCGLCCGAFRLEHPRLAQLSDLIELAGMLCQCSLLRLLPTPFGSVLRERRCA